MNFIFQLIYYLLTGLFAWLAKYFGEFIAKISIKTLTFIAYVALIVAVTAAYLSGLKLLVAGIAWSVPQIVLDVWGWVMPDNIYTCFSVMFSARAARWGYDKYTMLLQSKLAAYTN